MQSKICHFLQDILIHIFFLKPIRNPKIVDRCNVILDAGKPKGYSISIVNKSNFNDKVADGKIVLKDVLLIFLLPLLANKRFIRCATRKTNQWV
jgi:hypothetical protein